MPTISHFYGITDTEKNWRKCGRRNNTENSRQSANMFHRATGLKFLKGTTLEVQFQDGKCMQYDVKELFSKHPQLKALQKRELFLSGRLSGQYGIVWNDELDLDIETVYVEGKLVSTQPISVQNHVALSVSEARHKAGLTQKELAQKTGIDQSDISKLERGLANPSIQTLDRIAKATKTKLHIQFLSK